MYLIKFLYFPLNTHALLYSARGQQQLRNNCIPVGIAGNLVLKTELKTLATVKS